MMTFPRLVTSCPGLVHSSCPPGIFLRKCMCKGTRKSNNSTQFATFGVPRRKVSYHGTRLFRESHVMSSSGRNHQELMFDDELSPEPFWLSLFKELIWSLKSLSVFLREQPSQLKYIEWPSFQSTLKTATLTLVLVAVLIVALTSVDTTLSFVSRLLLRKTL